MSVKILWNNLSKKEKKKLFMLSMQINENAIVNAPKELTAKLLEQMDEFEAKMKLKYDTDKN